MPLREEDRHLTTFLKTWGRYEYCHLRQGHMTAGDAYTARYHKITQGFERMERCVDDMILHDSNLEENFHWVCKYFMTCSRAGITFNEEKFCFGRQQLEYLGRPKLVWTHQPSQLLPQQPQHHGPPIVIMCIVL